MDHAGPLDLPAEIKRRLSSIRSFQQHGRLADAIEACRKLLTDGDNPSLLALWGTLSCQRGDGDTGRECLDRLGSEPQDRDAETLTDIAGIHIFLKDPYAALRFLDHALAQAPGYTLARIRRGLAWMQLARYAEAKRDLQAGLGDCPPAQWPALHINLARCAIELCDATSALEHLERARYLGGHKTAPWAFVAVETYIALKRWTDAEAAIEDVLRSDVAVSECTKLRALLLTARGDWAEAEAILRETLAENPRDCETRIRLSALERMTGRYREAADQLQEATRIQPYEPLFWTALARTHQLGGDHPGARTAAETALELTSGSRGVARAEALIAMADLGAEVGDEPTERLYRDALEIVPGYRPARLGYGRYLMQWGRMDEAMGQFDALTESHPVAGYSALIRAGRFPEDPEILAEIERAAYQPGPAGPVCSSLLFDLAAGWEHRGDYDRAFRIVSIANAVSGKYLNYRAEIHREHCLEIIRTFDRAFFSARPRHGNPSGQPVFIVGMPRSGTTLVEQLLGGHPDIFPGGEAGMMSTVIQRLNAWERHLGSGKNYPECVSDFSAQQSHELAASVLAASSRRCDRRRYFIDKLPHNFRDIGLIRLLFPNAAIIEIVREPRDVAVSNYFTDYQDKFGGMGFAYSLADIGWQLKDYDALMAHWKSVLAKPILTVRYEHVVDDTEAALREILAYLDLTWTPKLLDYRELVRPVRTASIAQVRRPVYKTSKERWRRYRKFISPLERILESPTTMPVRAVNATSPAVRGGFFVDGVSLLQAKQAPQAAAVFEAILRDNPEHAAAMHMLGLALFQQGKLRSALDWIRTSIARHPGHSGWYRNLGSVYEALGKCEDARAAYETADDLHNAGATDTPPLSVQW